MAGMLRRYRGMLGDNWVGPVRHSSDGPIDVRLRRKWFAGTESSPLDPGVRGHYGWILDDGPDPIRGIGEVGIIGPGYNPGGSGVMAPIDPPGDDDPSLCPHLATDTPGGHIYCTDAEVRALRDAWRKIGSEPWLSYLNRFGTEEGELFRCMMNKGCYLLKIDCTNYRDSFPINGFDESVPYLYHIPRSLFETDAQKDPNSPDRELIASLVFALVGICGGSLLDMIAISELGGLAWKNHEDLLKEAANEAKRKGAIDHEGGMTFLHGKYVWWNPLTGDRGVYPYPDYVIPTDPAMKRDWICLSCI